MPKAESLKENLTATDTVAENGGRAAPDLTGRDVVRMVVTAPQGLNLRAGPGREFDVATVLPDGTEVNVWPTWAYGRGAQGWFEFHIPGWVYVFNGEFSGWADEFYLSLRPPAESV